MYRCQICVLFLSLVLKITQNLQRDVDLEVLAEFLYTAVLSQASGVVVNHAKCTEFGTEHISDMFIAETITASKPISERHHHGQINAHTV